MLTMLHVQPEKYLKAITNAKENKLPSSTPAPLHFVLEPLKQRLTNLKMHNCILARIKPRVTEKLDFHF